MKPFFIKTIFHYCHPSLSTGSKKILKKERKSIFYFFCSLKELRGEGSELRGHVPF